MPILSIRGYIIRFWLFSCTIETKQFFNSTDHMSLYKQSIQSFITLDIIQFVLRDTIMNTYFSFILGEQLQGGKI
jgi:hypothetical protein